MNVLFFFSIQELANLGTAAQETSHMEDIKGTPDRDCQKTQCLLCLQNATLKLNITFTQKLNKSVTNTYLF